MGAVLEGEWHLSADLRVRLTAWATNFHEHFDHEHGWSDQARCRAHRREGRQPHRLLQRELGSGYEVTVSLWETNDSRE